MRRYSYPAILPWEGDVGCGVFLDPVLAHHLSKTDKFKFWLRLVLPCGVELCIQLAPVMFALFALATHLAPGHHHPEKMSTCQRPRHDFYCVTMFSLLRILSFTISASFRAICYPFEVVLGSIFKALHSEKCRASDTEALNTCSTPISNIVSLRPGLWVRLIADGYRMARLQMKMVPMLCPTLRLSKYVNTTLQGSQRSSVMAARASSVPWMIPLF